jgi:hypothetical protein
MNHVVLIGNGFDLAHDLETGYMHFLNWYLKKIAISIEEEQFYEDDIVKIYTDSNLHAFAQNFRQGELSKYPESFLKKIEEKNYISHFKSAFIRELFLKTQSSTWVDIENLYYSWIVRIHKAQLANKNSNLKLQLEQLNKSFNEIKNQLEKYLISITKNRNIETKSDIEKHFEKIIKSLSKSGLNEICVVNFNYTNTLNSYIKDYYNIKQIQIHGKLNDSLNPIIFGYGDETDELYKEIENINDNEYLKFMKSFGYFKTNSYQQLIDFITGKDYTVHIMGHSCGLSDRVLLKRIFENPYCKHINIYYYQKNEIENDFINKCMDISRHFSIDKKDVMREKITPINPNFALVKFNKNS